MNQRIRKKQNKVFGGQKINKKTVKVLGTLLQSRFKSLFFE